MLVSNNQPYTQSPNKITHKIYKIPSHTQNITFQLIRCNYCCSQIHHLIVHNTHSNAIILYYFYPLLPTYPISSLIINQRHLQPLRTLHFHLYIISYTTDLFIADCHRLLQCILRSPSSTDRIGIFIHSADNQAALISKLLNSLLLSNA